MTSPRSPPGERIAEQGGLIGDQVVEQVAGDRHALTHALLAGLPIREVATTNYGARRGALAGIVMGLLVTKRRLRRVPRLGPLARQRGRCVDHRRRRAAEKRVALGRAIPCGQAGDAAPLTRLLR